MRRGSRRTRRPSRITGSTIINFGSITKMSVPKWVAQTGPLPDVRTPSERVHLAHPPQSMQTFTRFGPYEIVEQIGHGGMGLVYRARDLRLNRDVALKVIADTYLATATPMK